MTLWRKLLSVLFSFFLILYLVLFLIENIFPGFVSNVFALTYFLYSVLVFGILTALFPMVEVEEKPEVFKRSDIWLAIGLSILGAWLIYYKIDLAYPLRQVIGGLAGLLILLTSLLVVLPEDYKFKMPKFQWKYLFILLVAIPTIYLIVRHLPSPPPTSQTIVRLAPDKYQITLINRSENAELLKGYQQLLINNGYTDIQIGETSAYQPTTSTTIMYDEEDAVAGNEISDLLKQSYGIVQTSPLAIKADHRIVVILEKVN